MHVVHPDLLGGWGVEPPRSKEDTGMKLHANAPLSPKGRAGMARRRQRLALTPPSQS